MARSITVGIAGHVDHGKTSLVRCLTGVDTDRKQEEKARGLSIESGIAPLELQSGKRIALVDVPGHTDFLKNTIRGLSNVDMAVLVVAADDGVMPQTREHLEILKFFKVPTGFTALSKADLVDQETLEFAALEIEEVVKNTFLEGKPIIPFSSVDLRGIDRIRATIDQETADIDGKDPSAPFRLWIDQVRSITGIGTVISGTILSGTINEGDELCLLPAGKKTRARSLESHHQKISQAGSGERVGISLNKVSLDDVERGMVLARPDTFIPTQLINAHLRVSQYASKPIKNRQKIRLYLGTSTTVATAVLMEEQKILPGHGGLVQFRLVDPVITLPKDYFVVCQLDVPHVLGGGIVLESPRDKYREAKMSTTLPYLKALQTGRLEDVLTYYFKRNPNSIITAVEIAQNTGLDRGRLDAEMTAMVRRGELLYFANQGFYGLDIYKQYKKKLLEVIEKSVVEDPLKLVLSATEIKDQLDTSLDEVPFQKMLADLGQEGFLLRSNGGFHLPNPVIKLSREQEELITRLLDFARTTGLMPFSADRFWRSCRTKYRITEIYRALDYLCIQNQLVCLSDKRYLSWPIMEQIKKRVKTAIQQKGVLTIADSKEVLGYGRTWGIAVLDYLDGIGFTRRQGDDRVLTE
ncbi:MAG: selenocysteine-specific translation elongation factor [Deltaproteobacteria bacterium]|nr:selenocysteine-specific translation elongation factor [Deltaproteobacteria bacterium]